MRVLHVAGGDLYGGIERMLATLAGTRHDAVTQQFAVSARGRLWRELRELGATAAELPPARASRPLSVLAARRGFARIISSLAPDVCVFHGSWTHAMFATVARERGASIAFWQHAPIPQPGWPDRWASWTVPDVLVANSSFTATAPAFRGMTAEVIHCPVPMPPPVLERERTARRHALGAADSDVVAFLAARLEAWKGHTVLVEAARLLGRADVKVWIAGGAQCAAERPYLQRLEEAIAAASPHATVVMLGEREDVPELMRLADIYCQPNTAPEPFGIAIAEAMLAGLPCVVSNAGGAAELVAPDCGVLTMPGDARGVAAALSMLADDSARRGTMGRAAALRARTMTAPAARLADLAAAVTRQPVAV